MSPLNFRMMGMNNVDDPENIGSSAKDGNYPEAILMVNCDPDNTGGFSMRPGQALISSGDYDTAWANDDIFLCQSGSVLYRWYPETNTYRVLNIMLSDDAVYEDVNGVIVYSDGLIIRKIFQGNDFPIPDPTEQFKIKTPPGQCLTLFYRQLLVGSGRILYATEADTIDQCDRRICRNYFNSLITMIAPVDEGVYLSTLEEIYFMAGRSSMAWKEPGAVRKVADYPAFRGSEVKIQGDKTVTKAKGNICMFATKKGFCYGLNDGSLITTEEYLHPNDATRSCAIVREQNGLIHYLSIMRDSSDEAYNVFKERQYIDMTIDLTCLSMSLSN